MVDVEAEQIVRMAYEIARAQDIPGWVACFAEEGTFTDFSSNKSYKGPDQLGDIVQIFATAFPDMHRDIYKVYSAGNTVMVQLALKGTQTGPLKLARGTIPPTGKQMNAPCADFFELDQHGKIKRFDCYPEASIILEQLGVLGDFDAHLEH